MTTRSVQVPINICLRSNSFYAEIDDVTVEFVHENVIKLELEKYENYLPSCNHN
jgi:hypothetical protein